MLVSNIKSDFTLKTFKISLLGSIWNDNFRECQVLPDKLIAMATRDNLRNQK